MWAVMFLAVGDETRDGGPPKPEKGGRSQIERAQKSSPNSTQRGNIVRHVGKKEAKGVPRESRGSKEGSPLQTLLKRAEFWGFPMTSRKGFPKKIRVEKGLLKQNGEKPLQREGKHSPHMLIALRVSET